MENQEIEKIEKKMIAMERRISSLENFLFKEERAEPLIQEIKKLSIKEFVLSKKPEGNDQKILVIARFLEKYDNLSSFNVKDLIEGFETAKEKLPANINDRINKIIDQTGYIMSLKQKKDNLKAWVLTSSGESFIDNNLPVIK